MRRPRRRTCSRFRPRIAAAFFACWTRKEAYLKARETVSARPGTWRSRSGPVHLSGSSPSRVRRPKPERWELGGPSSPGPATSGPWPSSAPHDAVGCDRRHRLPLPRRSQLAGGVLALLRDGVEAISEVLRPTGSTSTASSILIRTKGHDVHATGRIRRGNRQVRRRLLRLLASRGKPRRSAAPSAARDRLRGARGRGALGRPCGGVLAPESSSGSRPTTTARCRCTLQPAPDRFPFDDRGASSIAANRISYMLDLRGPSSSWTRPAPPR